MFHLVEPQRWITLLLNLYVWMNESTFRQNIFPILADIFVFSYPLYLWIMYLYGKFRKQISHKIATLRIFTAVLASTIWNIFIQFFFDKARPNFVLWFVDEKTESILHKFLPSSSFPSDHAVVSMSIAVASIIRWVQKKQVLYIAIWIVLILFSLITSFSRVTIAIHRPTDIIGWLIVWITIPLIMSNKTITNFLEKKVFSWITRIF